MKTYQRHSDKLKPRHDLKNERSHTCLFSSQEHNTFMQLGKKKKKHQYAFEIWPVDLNLCARGILLI